MKDSAQTSEAVAELSLDRELQDVIRRKLWGLSGSASWSTSGRHINLSYKSRRPGQASLEHRIREIAIPACATGIGAFRPACGARLADQLKEDATHQELGPVFS
jgi:hypothetical protein